MSTVLADLLAGINVIDRTLPRSGSDRVIYQNIKSILARIGDFDYPSGTPVRNEVQQITAITGGVDGGTYTLTFTLYGGQTFTTAAIAFDAVAATIQTAIHTAAALAAVPGWATGHIAVTGGPLSTTTTVFTYSGASVAGKNHGQVTQNGAALTVGGEAGGAVGTASTTTTGGGVRLAWAALIGLGILGSTTTIPAQGATPSASDIVVSNPKGSFPHGLTHETVKALIAQAAYEDNNAAVETVLLAKLGL